MNQRPISNVPTNVITGFLGVGKTTLIQNLIQQKPKDERWAILVNEFGEIGIDGALLKGRDSQNVFIKEVPGGCMCCTSGLPMQIALNQLLKAARPHRLLIEPTGLGHPAEVLDTLAADHYQGVLDVRATLTLVDARKVKDPRWHDNATFQQQLKIADFIIANKTDTYADNDLANLHIFLKAQDLTGTPVKMCQHGKVSTDLLTQASGFVSNSPVQVTDAVQADTAVEISPSSETRRVQNSGKGFASFGWAYPPSYWFEFDKVVSVLSNLRVARLKAVFITTQGIFGFNLADGDLSYYELDESDDSRLEFIATDQQQANHIADLLEAALFN